MKKLRIMLMTIGVSVLLFSGNGCQVMSDLWPFGSDDPKVEDNMNDTSPITVDESEPGDWGEADAPVPARSNEWKRLSYKLPTIYFSYDKFMVGAREKRILDQLVDYLNKNKSVGIIVEGYCDERGSEEYNRSLGERRALAVHDYLVSKGISQDRIQTMSYGEEHPAVTGSNESAYAKNRRAELVLAKMK